MAALRSMLAALVLLAAPRSPAFGVEVDDSANAPDPIHRICNLIETHAVLNDIPREFFARLIWQESKYDQRTVSHAGAQGVAQFMPTVAAERGLLAFPLRDVLVRKFERVFQVGKRRFARVRIGG